MLQVLHLDNHVLALSKPAGSPTVPDSSGDPSLLEQAKAFLKAEFGKPGRVFLGVVHRLDRPVSGVLVFARTSKAAARLARAFRERDVQKTYWGIVSGGLRSSEGIVEQWLQKDAARNRVRGTAPGAQGAKLARTRWRTLAAEGRGSARRVLVELVPETGRPHQLRAAMASLGAPLLGDLKYGALAALPGARIALHARRLVLAHPVRGEPLELEAPCPEDELWRFRSLAARESRRTL